MDENIRILILEDLSSDAELEKRELKTVLKSYTVEVVDTEVDFVHALDTFKPDIIISDFLLPGFDGLSALKIKNLKCPFVPFIIVTGSMNEETAVECIKSGADDYVIKEHIKRLGSAVLSAIEKKKNEQNLNTFRILLDNSNDAIFIINPDNSQIIDIIIRQLFH